MRFSEALLVVVVIAVSNCGNETSRPPVGQPVPEDVTVAELLARPDAYNGNLVRVSGWCRIEFEGSSLYPDLESMGARNSSQAIWLKVGWPVPESTRAVNTKHVTIEGRFVAGKQGHEGMFSGMLTDIRSLTPTDITKQ